MDRVGSLLLAVLLISASSCTVQGETLPILQYRETYPQSAWKRVFQPLAYEPIQWKGVGYVVNTVLRNMSGGPDVGFMGGMYFYYTKTAVELITTITFSENVDGPWKGSSLNVRGLWNMKEDGFYALDNQELAIVGGQRSLKGASGYLIYKKLGTAGTDETWLVTCVVVIDDRLRIIHENLDTLYKSQTESVHVSPETTKSDYVLKQGIGSSRKDFPSLRA